MILNYLLHITFILIFNERKFWIVTNVIFFVSLKLVQIYKKSRHGLYSLSIFEWVKFSFFVKYFVSSKNNSIRIDYDFIKLGLSLLFIEQSINIFVVSKNFKGKRTTFNNHFFFEKKTRCYSVVSDILFGGKGF